MSFKEVEEICVQEHKPTSFHRLLQRMCGGNGKTFKNNNKYWKSYTVQCLNILIIYNLNVPQ